MKSLHNLINKATRAAMQQDSQIKQVISRIVPATAMIHINFCRLEAGRLRITVDNAIWIAKLRFSQRQIVSALRQANWDVVTLSFHVAPAEKPVTRRVGKTTMRSSQEASLAFIELADNTSQSGEGQRPGDRRNGTSMAAAENKAKTTASSASQPDSQVTCSVVRQPDDRLRQELLKLAAKLREEP